MEDLSAMLIQKLWDSANAMVGFAALQTYAFIYACAKEDFGDKINTKRIKLTILSGIVAGAAFFVLVFVWIAWRQTSLDPTNTDVYCQAAICRVILVLGLGIVSTAILYERQLRGIPFNKTVPYRKKR